MCVVCILLSNGVTIPVGGKIHYPVDKTSKGVGSRVFWFFFKGRSLFLETLKHFGLARSEKTINRGTRFFGAMAIHSRSCDLATALEYLLILTATKQKMQDRNNTEEIEGASRFGASKTKLDLPSGNLT